MILLVVKHEKGGISPALLFLSLNWKRKFRKKKFNSNLFFLEEKIGRNGKARNLLVSDHILNFFNRKKKFKKNF